MRNSGVAVILGGLLLTFLAYSLLKSEDTALRAIVNRYVEQGKRVVDAYSEQMEAKMKESLAALFDDLDKNKDGMIARDEFKGATLGMMAALRAVDMQRPEVPDVHLPSPGRFMWWIQTIFMCQLTFLTALFFFEHVRALVMRDHHHFDLKTDYKTAAPTKVDKAKALHYTTPMSTYERVKMIFFVCTGLVFVRLLLAFVFFSMAVCVITISTLGGRTRRRNPYWFRACEALVQVFGTLLLISVGFSRTVVVGSPAKHRDTKIYVANHVCVIEVVALYLAARMPSFVSRIENMSIPLFNNICRVSDAILVDRDAAASRAKTLSTILERANSADALPLMVFPEGTCSSQSALFQYRRGAFEAAVPIQMVCFNYPYSHFNPTWNGRPVGGNDLYDMLLRMCSQFVNRMEICFLPVYTPTDAEKADPNLFAEHVQAMMASVLRMPVSDASYKDYVEAAKAYAMHRKAHRLADKHE